MKKIILGILIIITTFLIYGFFIDTKGISINEYDIKNEKISSGYEGFKIAHFSDFLLGSTQTLDDLKKIINKINNIEPDIIVFTGDLISKHYPISDEEKATLKNLLSSLECNLYKYAVIGDNDYEINTIYKEIMNESGFQILDNESIYLFNKDINPIEIIGITNPNLPIKYKNEEGITPTYRILLTHAPDNINYFDTNTIDLAIAGHSLGGLIKIPFFGGIIKKTGATTYINEYYDKENMKLYISNGIGTEKYNFRAFNHPSINIYRLYKN